MRFSIMFLFTLVICTFAQAQTGPCTEKGVKQGNLPFAGDAPRIGQQPRSQRTCLTDGGREGFSAKTMRNYVQVLKMVVASAINE